MQTTSPILIVDDDPIWTDALKRLLQDYDLACEAAYSPADAIQKLSQHQFKFIVLDWFFGDSIKRGNGDEILQWITQNDYNVKIVILSGYLDIITIGSVLDHYKDKVIGFLGKGSVDLVESLISLVKQVIGE